MLQATSLQIRLNDASLIIKPEKLQHLVAELEAQTLVDGFWDATENAQQVMSKIATCKEELSMMKYWNDKSEDCEVALEFATQEGGVRSSCFTRESADRFTLHHLQRCIWLTFSWEAGKEGQ